MDMPGSTINSYLVQGGADMLGLTLTLSVDKANDNNAANEVFTRDGGAVAPNKSLYYGDLHTVDAKETLTFARVPAKINGNFKGTQRSSQKYSRTFTVLGVDGNNIDVIATTECIDSFPVGMTSAQKTEMRQYMVALRDNDTIMDAVHDQGQV